MMRRSSARLLAAVAAGTLLIAACSSSKSTGSGPTPADTAGATTTANSTTDTAGSDTTGAAPAWAVNTDDCTDPTAANAKITGTIKVGSVMPLTGGAAAAAFAPVKVGFEAYMDYANSKGMLGDVKIATTVEDDQYSKDLTPGAVSKLIDSGVNIVAGIIGTPDNLAVRQTLNDACIPQMNALTGSPHWGEVADFPWTTGVLVPYDTESKIYAAQLKELFPNGAKVALFYVDSEFGTAYATAFKSLAAANNLTIVDEETIGAEDQTLPAAQVTNIAAKKPDVVMAVPLGVGCVTFLAQLAIAKAQNAGWSPTTFITNTCASSLILGLAGAAADGLYTSGNLIDVGNPANASLPKVKEYLDYMAGIGKTGVATTAAAGWTTAEVTVAMLKQAQASPDGLTRASIINAARNFTFTPMLARAGIVDKMNGEKDPFLSESLQVLQYKAGKPGTFTDVGKLITQFEH